MYLKLKQIAIIFICCLFIISPYNTCTAITESDYISEESIYLKGTNSSTSKTIPEKCTGAYVGKDVCEEGTTLIARSEDQINGAYNKMFLVEEKSSESGRSIVDTGEGQKGFSVPIPENTYKYTYLSDASDAGDGIYYASCMNECGLAVSGTVSTEVSEEYAKIDPLKEPGDGIREAILPAIVACQAATPEDAVKLLASYIDEYGSSECNTVLFSDKKEAWIFEIYGGYTYAAMRLPDDKMAVFGNQIMLDWIDFENMDGWYASENLKACLDQTQNPVIDENGRYHLSKTITPGPREAYSNMRTWRGHKLFAPSETGDYSDDVFYSLLFTPDEKVSVLDIMELFGDRYQGTQYDMEIVGNEDLRPIGVMTQSDVHIIQTFPELPDCTCQLQWLAMGNAEHSIFVPAFSGITDTYEKYQIDNTESGVINDSYYYVCKQICALAATDREYLSQGVKDYNKNQQKMMLDEIMTELPKIQKRYDLFEFVGNHYVTKLANDMAQEQYENALSLYKHLAYTQMDNLNDRLNNENKTVFSMPN